MEGTEEGSSTRTPQLSFAFVDVYAVWEDEMGGSYPPLAFGYNFLDNRAPANNGGKLHVRYARKFPLIQEKMK